MLKNEKNHYTRCYIAFLDLLGFKSMIGKTSCQDILDIFTDMKNPLASIKIGNGESQAEIPAVKQIQTKVMSDSICFFIDAELQDALFCLLCCCAAFQAKLLNRPIPILVRGAIVLGDVFSEGDIIFGSGITNAYLLEEGNAKYPRIIITKETLMNGLKNISRTSIKQNVDVYAFCDSDKYYVANWLGFFFDMASVKNKESNEVRYHKLSAYIDSILGSETNASIREKYLYLDATLSKYFDEKLR